MPMERSRKQAYSIHSHETVGPLLKIQRSCIRIEMKGSPSNPPKPKVLMQSSQAGKMQGSSDLVRGLPSLVCFKGLQERDCRGWIIQVSFVIKL